MDQNVTENTMKLVIWIISSARQAGFLRFPAFGIYRASYLVAFFLLRAEAMLKSFFFFFSLKDYCATKWSVLRERFDRGLYASHADLHRLK